MMRHTNWKRAEGVCPVFMSIYLQRQCLCCESALPSSTRGNTRPPESQPSGSHWAPHTPRPHTLPSPCRTHRLDTTRGSISDCWSTPVRFLCSCLSQARAATVNGVTHTSFKHPRGHETPSLCWRHSLVLAHKICSSKNNLITTKHGTEIAKTKIISVQTNPN